MSPVPATTFLDAIFIQYIDHIEVWSETGQFLVSIPTRTDTGWPTNIFTGIGTVNGGFAFSQDYTKLIVSGGSDLHYYDVVVNATTFSITYGGIYAALGTDFQCYAIAQGRPWQGDFICHGFSNISNALVNAAYVTNLGAVTIANTTLFAPSFQNGSFMYIFDSAFGMMPNPGNAFAITASKDSLSGDNSAPTDPVAAGYSIVWTDPDAGGATPTQSQGFSEVFRDGSTYATYLVSGSSDGFVAVYDAGGAGSGAMTTMPLACAQFSGGINHYIQSYLHFDRGYAFANRPDGSGVPVMYKSTLPFTLPGEEITVISQMKSATPHCYKYPVGEFPPPPPGFFEYPGLSRFNASTAAQEFFVRT